MTFSPPEFSTLRLDTANLEASYSSAIGRYTIVEPRVSSSNGSFSSLFEAKVPEEAQKSSTQERRSSLEILIAKTQVLIKCPTRRETERDVFVSLVGALTELLEKGEKKQIDNGTLILLGALLHRYFRLVKQYNGEVSTIPLVLQVTNLFAKTVWDIRDCHLFSAIRTTLGLPDYRDASRLEDFLVRDMKLIDPVTRLGALEVFRENMYKVCRDGMPRYQKFLHFREDKNFITHLDEIIKEQQILAAPVLKQYKPIYFIQSVGEQVAAESLRVEAQLQEWGTLLQQEHSGFEQLTQQAIREHIEGKEVEEGQKPIGGNIPPGAMRELFIDLLYTDEINTHFKTLNHVSFIKRMKQCYHNIMAATICGAYVLILRMEGIEESLQSCLYETLGLLGRRRDLTDQDKLLAIRFLDQFMKRNPDAVLRDEFFDKINGDGRAQFLNLLRENLKSLSGRQENEVVEEDGFTLVASSSVSDVFCSS